MALLSTYQKFKEKNAQGNHGGQSEPQKQETQKESSGRGLMSTYQQFMAKQQGQETAYTPESDYGQRVMDVIGKVGNSAASRNGEWTADASGGNAAEINALLREYDAYTGDKSGMTEYRNALLDYNKRIQAENQYYAGFGTKDDFNRVRSGYTNFGVGYDPQSYGLDDASARKLRQEAAQNDAMEAQRALAELNSARKNFAAVDSEWRAMDERYRSFTIDEYDKDLTQRWQAAKDQVTAAENALLNSRNRMDAYNATWGKVDKYGETSEAAKGTDTSYTGPRYESIADWENKKNEEQAAQDAQAQRPDYVPGTLRYTSDTEPVADDRLGLWRSLTPEQKQDAVNSSNVQLNNVVMAGNDGYWDLLTDNEVETYYYIKGKQGQEAANQYLDDMYIELSRRNELKTVQSIENANSWEKAGLTAVSVGANLVGAIPAAMGKTADMVTGRTNPYSSMQFFQRYASYIRGSVGQDIGDWTESKLADKFGEQFAAKAGNLANQTFQALMSGVDSMAGAMTFGQGLALPAGPFNFHVGGYTTVMGMGAFAQRAQELELKGATPTQIAIGSIGSGVLEALFEDVSMEVFFTNILDNPAKTAGEFVKKLAIQMGVEGSEEMFTEMGNIILDAINMGKNSENSMAVREYMAQGMTEEKARQQVWKDNAVDILWAGYGGAISAGAMAAGGQALSSGVNRVHSTVGNYAVGSQLLENGRAVDLQEQAASLTNEKKRAKLQKAAAEVASNTSAGDKSFRNTYRTGKVATQIAQQAGREARGAETAEFRKAAEKYLEGQRGIQNKKLALNVLTRAYDGTAMLPGDKAYMRMIGGEKLTQEILNSVGGKETLQENAKPSVEASMRTIGNVQSSVLGIAPETKAEFDSDNSGQAFRKSDSEPINILASEPISRVENGVLYLNTDDGQEIAASDVSYGNSGEAAVYAAISNMQTDTETARSLLSGIDDSGLSSAAYARAIRNAYYRGMNGVKFEDTPGYSDAAKLPEAQRRAAWEAGKQRRAAKVQEREALIDSGKAGTRESGVTMQESAKSIRNLNKQQQTGMAAAKALAAAGLHVEVYASTEAERKAGKPNGIYRKEDGSIAIDLNAGDNGQGAVAYALAHETNHFIQDYAPAKFETYAELIIAAAESKGISYDSLLARQLARLSEMEEYKNLSETELQEIAYDETIAEMSETILTDTDAASRLSQQIYKQDRTLWQKIKDFFTGLVEKLRNAYRDSDPDSDIGRMLKRAVQDNAEIAQAWAEAVREAGENYQLHDGQKNNARVGEMSDEALKNSPGDVKHSLRRNGELQQKAEKVNQKNGFVSDDVMAKAAEVRNAIADIMLDPELQESLGLPPDIEGNTFFSDSSYGGSEENTTICPRSMGAEALLDAVSDLIGRPLTVDEQIVVSQEMQNRTANPECVYCYVATDRKAYREFLGEYIKQRDQVLKDASRYTDTKTYTKAQIDSMTDAQKANSLYVQFLNGRKPTKNMASRFKMWMDISASGKQLLQASDLTSISRLEELKAKDFSGITKDMAKQIKDAMRYAQSASWAKKRVGYTAYNGHILNWKQSRIDNLNSQYGLRMYSFSDFSPAFILENMQMVTDAATRGLKMLAYTKDLNFVKIFAKTGMNINVSCFGYEVGGNVYENNLQGAAWADAQKLRAENPNVGVVFVTYNDAMTKWAMQQEWVDVVIPYHLVRTGTKVAEAFGFTNYTDISGDKKITESWVKGQDEAHITPPMHENNLEKYLAACEENHLTPRFQKFLNDPELRPYYMKLVNETRRSAQETPTVQPVFDQRSAEIALQDMRNEGGYFQPIGGSVDKMVDIAIEISEKIQKREGDKFSSRNSGESMVDRLVRKNEELKAEAEYLKQVVQIQKQGNRKNLRDRESVNAIAKGILESVNAKDGEFGKKLNDFYRDLVTVEMDYDTMQEKAGELADRALEHHQAERDSYAQEVLDFLKKRRVSLTESQIGDAEYTYGSLSEFKKAIKGSIILDQNSTTSLDQLWQEAAARFPDRFGTDTTEADMPDGIANIVSWANSAEADSETEFQYYKAETKADLTRKILMGYLEAKPMESVSDSMKKKLDDLKAKHKAEMADLRQKGSQALEAERQRNAAAIATMKAAQRAVDIAQKGLWETERQEIKHSYEQQMKELKGQYSEDTGTMQKEFFRLLREYEKQQAKGDRQSAKDSDTISELREALSKEAQSHKEDSAAWNKEFSRLLREYETSGRKVDRLEAKVKQQREAAAQKVESRKKTEERHKLQNTIDTLNKYLLQPTNTAHVPQGLQSSVAMALRAINGVIGDSKAAQNADRLAEYAYRLRELEKNPSANGDKIADLNRKIQNLTGKDSSMKAALAELQEQYHKLETQGNNLYDSNIEALIQNTMEQIGDTEYRNLSLQQLKAVRDSYTALLTTIRNANKAFVAGKNARIDEMVQRATTELSLMKKKNPNQTAMGKMVDQFFWNNEKPVYAFERIGSAVMSELYDNLRKGEDTFYRDVSQARDFFLESAEKNGFSKWDLNELKEFTAADGRKFQLSLDELMSLYAYSLRPQAREHLTRGGIVLGENTKRFTNGPLGVTRETTYNDANAYTLTDETIDAIAGSLTKEQRQFAFEMQQYLAKIMGAKGDEVNMALYGIKKFGEETYWPLKSSGVFSERIREQQERTGNKVKNSGFTKALTQHANNAIELSSLTETWAQHVNDMSMYHAFTLPMEDFYRVYNWTQKGDSKGKQTMGVRQMIQQTAGKGAVTYIDQFLKDLNGGLRADPRETVSKAMLSGFKKAAVSASLSVAIQQPSAVGRALAYIEPKYFIGSKVEGTKFAETWKQLKKYAAVAGLKEMGRFDVDMGRSTLEYIIGRNGLSTWGKITDKVDEFSGWLPEMADQVTWCGIWEAAKRKTAAQNPGLKGEALLQKAGELFTDTITRTQVYDSVFSRSANMRSKSGLMSMATAFMAEPTTTANMVEDAVRKFARGDKRMAGKVMSSVAVATVLNAALASVVYAARDDDDDKTYWEKYMASLAGETVDSFNPLTYIPVLSDINNLLLGYSIERTDMSLASDLITALKKITTLYGKYDDEWSDEEKKEWKNKVRDAWLDNAWMVGTVMGLPLKNVVRDVEAVFNTARNPRNGAEMSADTVLKAVKDSARKNFPILSWKADESSSDQLYKAITQGKNVLARRLKAQFGDEKKYESALLKGLRENDPRIKTAAQYAIDVNTPKRVAIIREIVAEGHYTQDQVIKAINQKANSMKEKTQSGKESPPEKLYDYSEYVNAAANGLGYAGDVQKELIRYQADRNQEADGKLTRQEAESDALKTFQSNVKSDAKDGYATGELTEAQVRKVLISADIAEDEELDDLILQWDTELELGREIDWGDTKYLEYAEEIRPAGISVDVYDEWLRQVNYYLTGVDEDGDGKADRNSAVKQKAAYINSLPLTAEQKEALWRTVSTSARTLRKYRLW